MKRIRTFFSIIVVFIYTSCAYVDLNDFEYVNDELENNASNLRHYQVAAMSSRPLFEFLIDEQSKLSASYEREFRKTCDYAKIPYRSRRVADFSQSGKLADETRVIAILDTKSLSDLAFDQLLAFVARGGTLVLPCAPEDRRCGFLIGLKPDAEPITDVTAAGIYFTTSFLPGMKNKTSGDEGIHFGFIPDNFSTTIRYLATAANNHNYPLITENAIGEGKVIYFNTTYEFSKLDRGLLFSAVLKGLESVPYPIANTSTIFLDDFPSPLYKVKAEPIKTEMNLSNADFVLKVWWPDMQALSKKFNISYSAMIAFDYKNKMEPPFGFDQWDDVKIKNGKKSNIAANHLVFNVAENHHELAFHGYNHVSLTKNAWPKKEHIGPAMQAVQKKWKSNAYGKLPITYVPPSNIIDYYGINELKKNMPSLQFMCSLYLGETADGGGREFDFDPYNNLFFDYPRITSGFCATDKNYYSQMSLFLFSGIWTHFVHPDDVYQIASPFNKSKGNYDLRNGKSLGWRKAKGQGKGMLHEFSEYLEKMVATYPKIRFLNAGQSGAIVNDWRASQFKHSIDGGTYVVQKIHPNESAIKQQFWFLYSSLAKEKSTEIALENQGASYSKTPYLDGSLYMIHTKIPLLKINNWHIYNTGQKEAQANTILKITNEYVHYKQLLKEAANKLFDAEANELKKQMLALQIELEAPSIDSTKWHQYANYLLQEDRGQEMWTLLEQHCKKYPLKENYRYASSLEKLVYYKDENHRQEWLEKQIMASPSDKNLLNNFIADYNTIENKMKIKDAYIKLIAVDTSTTLQIKYLQHLLLYEQDEAYKMLLAINQHAGYREIATEVAWLMSDYKQYKKALEWSALTDAISFTDKMNWLLEIKDYKALENNYLEYIKENQFDYLATSKMIQALLEQRRIEEAWLLANQLPDTAEKETLKRLFNQDIVFESYALQQKLMAASPSLFYPEVLEKIKREHRIKYGRFVALNSEANSNRSNPQAWKNHLSYNWYDARRNLHSVSSTYSTMYRVADIKDIDNITHAVGGFQYKYRSKEVPGKPQYNFRGRLEYSDYKKFYAQIGGGADLSKPKSYQSVQLDIFPAETGPAHSKQIYRSQLTIYQDYYFLRHLNGSIALEGNYYNASRTNSIIKSGASIEGSITGRIGWDVPAEKKIKYIPFLEGAYSEASLGKSSINPETGYPFWLIDSRIFGGGGLLWKYGKSDDPLQIKAEATYFFDDYTQNYQRYTGKFAYQIVDFAEINASFEIYVQSKFYSNNVQIGMRYYLK